MCNRIIVILALLLPLASCSLVDSLLRDDVVVARMGDKKLYRSELMKFIPENVSPQDSANYAERYIKAWALDNQFMKVAQAHLSKAEMDVTEELESYRSSLIKYRFEQRYISDRLDTLITEDQVQKYYDSHKDDFALVRPLLKVRYVHLMKDSPSKDSILEMMESDGIEDSQRADTLARTAALRYFDSSDAWMDAGELAKEFGVDYKTMLENMNGDMIKIEPEGRGDLMAAYVCDIIMSGFAPVEYCSPGIRDIILSNRKYELLVNLEQDLQNNAEKSLQLETDK